MAAKKKTASPISEKPATSQKEIKEQVNHQRALRHGEARRGKIKQERKWH